LGIGPSSSHTLGSLKIAQEVRHYIIDNNMKIKNINIYLMGSFAHTGKGHLTDKAAVAGLCGFSIKEDGSITEMYEEVENRKKITIDKRTIDFNPEENIIWDREKEVKHPNTINYEIITEDDSKNFLTYYSVGGGDIKRAKNFKRKSGKNSSDCTFSDIVDFITENDINFLEFLKSNEMKLNSINEKKLYDRLSNIWSIMQNNIESGLKKEGKLPGKLGLERRAKQMYESFLENLRNWRLLSRQITLANIYAISVAEENASGEKIITAPTCGSCGILPSALKVMKEKYHISKEKVLDALIISGFIGAIIKKNGSISGAEVGCQGEVGVAASMAAAAVCFLLNGNLKQIEGAAEIALEHHLGLTCDPIGGLVQIPCIERNGVGVITSLNAANLSLMRKTEQKISLDYAIDAMMEIGNDMNKKYKETSLGGLAGQFAGK